LQILLSSARRSVAGFLGAGVIGSAYRQHFRLRLTRWRLRNEVRSSRKPARPNYFIPKEQTDQWAEDLRDKEAQLAEFDVEPPYGGAV
jgi:hypothetical protein